jgi:hypothetical protein
MDLLADPTVDRDFVLGVTREEAAKAPSGYSAVYVEATFAHRAHGCDFVAFADYVRGLKQIGDVANAYQADYSELHPKARKIVWNAADRALCP